MFMPRNLCALVGCMCFNSASSWDSGSAWTDTVGSVDVLWACGGETCADELSGACNYVPFMDKFGCCKTIADANGYPAAPNGQCPETGTSSFNDPSWPTGCFFSYDLGGDDHMYFNEHPNGAAGGDTCHMCKVAEAGDCCAATDPWQCAPAPTPAPMSASGDPIVKVKGHVVKFDMPLNTDTLLLADRHMQVFGRADLITPDQRSQWFSSIAVLKAELEIVRIERKALGGRAKSPNNELTSLHLSINNQKVSALGAYLDGQVRVYRDGLQLGYLSREVVTLSWAESFQFVVAPQVAKKFRDKKKALSYVHLDMDLQDIKSANGGIFAEFYGFIPMSRETARLIRQVKTESQIKDM